MNPALNDLSVVHQLCFAARSISNASPRYWDVVTEFEILNKPHLQLSTEVRVFIENLKLLNEDVFATDTCLLQELVKIPKNNPGQPQRNGIILISTKEECILCHSKLYLRSDRSVSVVTYDNTVGSLPATHFTKYCRKTGCSLQQHYGYSTSGSNSDNIIYDKNALDLPYFMSSRETRFSVRLLKHFDSECLLGQISYKQSAEIYNDYHGYNDTSDQSSRYARNKIQYS